MWIFFILFLTVIGTSLMLYAVYKDHDFKGLCGFISAFIILFASHIHCSNTSEPEPAPTALDVYRGNTELEITSVNGVPTDTVVIFKNK